MCKDLPLRQGNDKPTRFSSIAPQFELNCETVLLFQHH